MNSHFENHSHRTDDRVRRISWIGALCVALALTVTSSRGATLTVTNTADSGSGSLRGAIAAATNGDVIVFSLPSPSTIALTSGRLLISQSLTISGPGPGGLAISGSGSNGVFEITNGPVFLTGLEITNGTTGLHADRMSTVVISNVVVTGNSVNGIYNDTATVQAVNCSVSNNLSHSTGGGIYLTAIFGTCTLSMTNSTVTGNSATNGGGIAIEPEIEDAYVMNFSNVVVSSNRAFVSGGGFYSDHGQPLTLANLTLSDNTAGGGGGGIENGHDSLTLSNVTLTGNSSYAGGAIFNDGAIDPAFLTVFNSTISNNSAGSGAGIFTTGHEALASVRIFGSSFTGNTAINNGGAIYNDGTGGEGDVSILGSTFSSNVASNGAGVYNYSGPFQDYGIAALRVTNSTFSGNSASTGGAVYNLCSTPTDPFEPSGSTAIVQILNSTLSGNSATNGGGGVFTTVFNIGTAPVLIGSSILNAGAFGGTISNNAGSISSSGYNLSSDDAGGALTNGTDLINTDPKLGPLQNNGGAVFTQALLPGSPAIDQGFNFSGFANDGRGLGFVRTYDYPAIRNALGGDGTDIGAFELQPATTDFATWQLQYFGGANNPQAAPTADPDGDGADNMSEFLAGTNPRNSASVFRVLSVSPQGNDLLVTWQTAGGHTNILQSSGSLTNEAFSDTSPALVIPGIGDATNSFLQTGAAHNGSNSFYRVRLGQ